MMTRQGMKRLALPLGLAALLTVGAGLALGRERYEEKFARSEALAKNGKVYVDSLSGDVEVQTWNQDQVKIEALKISEASSLDKAKENAALVPIEVTRDGDTLRIVTKYPERHGLWGGGSLNVSVDYKLWVPEKASVEVESKSGDVKLAPIGGMAKVRTLSGDVVIGGSAGADVDVKSGDVTADNILGDAYLKTLSGNVHATKVKGSVEAESVSGDVELKDISEAKTATGKSVSGDVVYTGTVLAGGNYEFSTHSGDVTMRIPANAAFDLEANSFSGTIDSDFEIQVMGKLSPNEIHGTVNGGGARVRVKSFSGDVEIKKH